MKKAAILLALLVTPVLADEVGLKPFTTDGCSLFPDGDQDDNSKWMACCVKHDYAYWKGGTEGQREFADLALQRCVADLGENSISAMMLLGVRLGGGPYYPTSYRWGYGWPYLRGYQALNDEEKAQVKLRMSEFLALIESLAEEQ